MWAECGGGGAPHELLGLAGSWTPWSGGAPEELLHCGCPTPAQPPHPLPTAPGFVDVISSSVGTPGRGAGVEGGQMAWLGPFSVCQQLGETEAGPPQVEEPLALHFPCPAGLQPCLSRKPGQGEGLGALNSGWEELYPSPVYPSVPHGHWAWDHPLEPSGGAWGWGLEPCLAPQHPWLCLGCNLGSRRDTARHVCIQNPRSPLLSRQTPLMASPSY